MKHASSRLTAFLFFSSLLIAEPSGATAPTLSPELKATQKTEDQFSCAHLKSRFNVLNVATNLLSEAKNTVNENQSRGASLDLYEYFKRKVGFSLGSILSEVSYTGKLKKEALKGVDLSQVDAYALVGVGGIDLRQGTFPEEIEFDVHAVDVCFGDGMDLVLFSGCKMETTVFDTCDYLHDKCDVLVYWRSKPFLVKWWECKSEVHIPMDLRVASKAMGMRLKRIPGVSL